MKICMSGHRLHGTRHMFGGNSCGISEIISIVLLVYYIGLFYN